MVLRGWQLNFLYRASIPRTFGVLQVGPQIRSRDRFMIVGVPPNSFSILSSCIWLPSHAVFGQVSKHNLWKPLHLSAWSSQGEEHAHLLRKPASAGGVHHTKRHTQRMRGGQEYCCPRPISVCCLFLVLLFGDTFHPEENVD